MTENMISAEDRFNSDVSLARNDAHHCYELQVGGKTAVRCFFLAKPGHVDFTHTETAEGFKGQGLGKVLVHFALDDVVASGKRIIPHDPFVAPYVRQHEGYKQYVDWPEA
jgi:predicted GNAT family acetyltransferase